MPFSRRDVFAGIACGFVTPFIGSSLAHGSASTGIAFLSCARRSDGSFALAALSRDGTVIGMMDLPGRGHAITVSPTKETAIIFGRRPANWAMVVHLPDFSRVSALNSPRDRHFMGHGTFSADGKFLYTTENDFESARGVVGVYDAQDDWRRVGEFDSGGIGPHEILLLSDNQTLAVANGGIETHPDFPRQKLNLPTMRASLSYLNAATGRILEVVQTPSALHQLSLRHIAEDTSGAVWFGCQYEGPGSDTPALIGSHRRGTDLALLDEPSLYMGLENYIGSISVDPLSQRVAASAPRGNAVLIIDTESQTLVERLNARDVCGISSTDVGFVFTSGTGAFSASHETVQVADVSWDNHITSTI